jgi:hypothetical protein
MDRLDKLTVLSGSGDNSHLALDLSADLAERLGLSVIERWRVADVIDSHIQPIMQKEIVEVLEDFTELLGFVKSLVPADIDMGDRTRVIGAVNMWYDLKKLIERTFL